METETVKLNWQLIHACETERGGFTRLTIEAFGINWPPISGWVQELCGVSIPQESYARALEGKHLVRSKRGIRDNRIPKPTVKATFDRESARLFNALKADDWTVEDWADLHQAIEGVKIRVAQRHGIIRASKS